LGKTILILADGTCFSGLGFGALAPSVKQLLSSSYTNMPVGELVFNTSMGAYHEIITDPSYAGQSIVMTAPHIGNYGLNRSWNEMQFALPVCKSIIVRDLYTGAIPLGRESLETLARKWNLCGMTDVDTRALTLHIRQKGSQYGVVIAACDLTQEEVKQVIQWLIACPPMQERDFISSCTVEKPQFYPPEGNVKRRFALWDFGFKQSIVKQLQQRGVAVTVFPAVMPLSQILTQECNFDALLISNGPGDPATLGGAVDQLRGFLGTIPLLGICLGHQLLALALGGKTEKMLFGHHGSNHPVRDLQRNKVYVTAQNHGYCVLPDSLPPSATMWLVNNNDKTLEGFYDLTHTVMAVQFHPEAAPGPWEARQLFDTFIQFSHLNKESSDAS